MHPLSKPLLRRPRHLDSNYRVTSVPFPVSASNATVMAFDLWQQLVGRLAVIVNFVVLLSVLLGCCAIVFDIGWLQLMKLRLQNAADAAALGGLYQIEHGGTSWQNAAIADAGLNGFVNGINNVTVTLTNPPTSGTFINDRDAVVATVSKSVKTMFIAGYYTLSAQATALLPPCYYMLSTSASIYTLTMLNNTFINATCSVYVGRSTYETSGSGGSAYAFYSAGALSASSFGGTGSVSAYLFGSIEGVPVMTDPLAYYLAYLASTPHFSLPCTYTNETVTGVSYSSPATAILLPGTYCGGITLTNAHVTLNSGLYVIAGGINWSGSTVTGSGVTLYMTSQTTGSGYGQFNVSSNSAITLTAPTVTTGGALPGITIFGDINWVATQPEDLRFSSSSLVNTGIIYFTKTGLSCTTSTMQGSPYFGMVVDHSVLSGCQMNLSTNYSSLPGGNPFRPKESLVQ
jgi:Flp pilus assembly protein TadG